MCYLNLRGPAPGRVPDAVQLAGAHSLYGVDLPSLRSGPVDVSPDRANIVPVAAGDLKCVGGSCSRGGSWGATGMYEIDGRVLCRSCAIKELGIENRPAKIQIPTLERQLLGR